MGKRILTWGPVLAWVGFIFLLSNRQSISVSTEYVVNFSVFKTLHLIEYGFLFLLCYRGFRRTYPKAPHNQSALAAFELTIIFAVFDEIHQLFVPTRGGKLQDVIIDGIGATLAWIFLRSTLPLVPKKLRQLARTWHVL